MLAVDVMVAIISCRHQMTCVVVVVAVVVVVDVVVVVVVVIVVQICPPKSVVRPAVVVSYLRPPEYSGPHK